MEKQCPSSIHILYYSENESVTMYETTDNHLHQESKSTGINQQSKNAINELFKIKLKPKRILEILEEKGLSSSRLKAIIQLFDIIKRKIVRYYKYKSR